jgi:5-oxoprolinase (ATP-hydrolysing) subunit C
MILGRYPHFDFKSPIRVVLGPQHHHFSAEALNNLIAQPYTVTLEADRMGIRLSGPSLSHRPEYGADITSDATVPGSIQVPGNGQPIVLLADGQTVGGYAKIATVISADLPRLACAMPGQAIHFEIVNVPTAEKAARQAEADVLAFINSITPLKTRLTPDTETLLGCNLISGMINALEKNHFNHVCSHD